MTGTEEKTLAIDIDHTLCQSEGHESYQEATPIEGAREALSQLRENGWHIILHTARHFNHWKVTRAWLEEYGFEYDEIVYGKPPARYYIDDRAMRFEGNWEETLRTISGSSAENNCDEPSLNDH